MNFKSLPLIMSSFCVLNHPLDFVEKKDLKLKKLAPFEAGVKDFKKPEALEEFILSHSKGNADAHKNLKSYKPLILRASKVFKVPFSFQSCLLYKESRFNPKAKSHVGALGVAQFTEETYDFLAKALLVGMKQSLKPYNYSELRTQYEFNLRLYKKMYFLWQSYLESSGLKDLNLSEMSHRDFLLRPEYAIGFSGLYLYYLKNKLRFHIKEKARVENFAYEPEMYLSLAGAYNQGAKRLLKIASRDKKINFSKWIEHQSRFPETRGYIESIKNCMQSESKSDVARLGVTAS